MLCVSFIRREVSQFDWLLLIITQLRCVFDAASRSWRNLLTSYNLWSFESGKKNFPSPSLRFTHTEFPSWKKKLFVNISSMFFLSGWGEKQAPIIKKFSRHEMIKIKTYLYNYHNQFFTFFPISLRPGFKIPFPSFCESCRRIWLNGLTLNNSNNFN